MTKNEIKNLTHFIVEDNVYNKIEISVSLVNRASFNDERLIESTEVSIIDLKDKSLIWFDPYLKKAPKIDTKFAFVYLNQNDELYILINKNNKLSLEKTTYSSFIYSDYFNESYLIATTINLRRK